MRAMPEWRGPAAAGGFAQFGLVLSLSKDEAEPINEPASWFDRLTMRLLVGSQFLREDLTLSSSKDEVRDHLHWKPRQLGLTPTEGTRVLSALAEGR